MRQLRVEMRKTRSEFSEFKAVIGNLTSRVDSCEQRLGGLERRVADMETITSSQPISSERGGDDGSLVTCIEALKAELNERDQELLLNDVEITCVPEQKGEGLQHISMSLAAKLGVTIAEQDIVCATRVGRVPSPAEGAAGGARPRPIVVRLARRTLRDQLLQAARVRRGATTEGIGSSGSPRRFYVNERLTRVNRQLFRRARDLGDRHNWRFVWTRDGRIFVRQHHGANAARHRIRSEADLVRIFGEETVGGPERKNK